MKNSIISPVLFIIIGFVLINILGCEGRKEPDPCEEEGLHPVTADFTIKEVYQFNNSVKEFFVPVNTDTIVINYAEFTALEEDAKYTWIIGAETLHERTVERHGFPKGVSIPITLIVEKEPNLLCFPDDDGIDTLTRYLYKTEDTYHHKTYGDFIGYLERFPQDTFTISIYNKYIAGNSYLNISNIKGICDSMEIHSYIRGFNQIAFFVGSCDLPRGQILLSKDDEDEIKISYTFGSGEHTGERFVFRGRRK